MTKEIGVKIKMIRDSHNLSQERFGMKLGLSGKTISAYENGRTTPPLKILQKITQVYDTPYISVEERAERQITEGIDRISSEIEKIRNFIRNGLNL